MAYFEFRDVVIEDVSVIDEWLDEQPDDVRAHFDSDFKHLASVPVADWGLPKVTQLQGYDGILEFRVKLKKVRYRIGGFHGPQAGDVTLCSGWTHSESAKAQRRAMDLAAQRKAMVIDKTLGTVLHV
jgi:Phage derived protein Gp49-like (DUF891)